MCDIYGCDEEQIEKGEKPRRGRVRYERQGLSIGTGIINRTDVRYMCKVCAEKVQKGKMHPVFKPKPMERRIRLPTSLWRNRYEE
jgi:hypothetical protein